MAEDHPHIHGEYRLKIVIAHKTQGSPPYTWGIPRCTSLPSASRRITPIYMGNTSHYHGAKRTSEDHPHIHGEYSSFLTAATSMPGSPPYTWGIRFYFYNFDYSLGITPIYMGNTRLVAAKLNRLEDHPHIHGEYTKRLPTNQAFAPSIPQFLFSLLI